MKIYEGHSPILPTNPKNEKKTGEQGEAFQKIMDQVQTGTMQKDGTSSPVSIGPQPEGVQILQNAEKIARPQGNPLKEMVLDELKSTLDLVDFYAAKLGNTSLPVTDLHPLVEHLDDRLQNLRGMESNPGLPERLRPIVNDVVVTLGTEIAKFKRGDYV